jgi:hypothetical protein
VTQSKETPAAEAATRETDRRRRPLAIAFRIALIGVIVVAMVYLAHVLRDPDALDDAEPVGAGAPSADPVRPPETTLSGGAPPPDETPTTQQEADDDLRQIMAGLIMAALGEGDTGAARDPEPTDAQRRVADIFALPYDYPQSEAPADLIPETARVMMVFDNPARRGSRMVLVRVPGGLGEALEAFHRHYASLGWERRELANPRADRGAQPDRGWMVQFRKVREGRTVRERIVYARARDEDDETLVAIYDPNYAGE